MSVHATLAGAFLGALATEANGAEDIEKQSSNRLKRPPRHI